MRPLEKPLSAYMPLYLVLETSMLRLSLGDFIMQAIEGGVTAIQLRDKARSAKERYETAKTLHNLLKDKDVLFIINNSADMALAVGAHGVHLGVEDLPPHAVKKMFPHLVTGYSCNNEHDCSVAVSGKIDYAGVGPVFFTSTKVNLRPVLSIQGMQAVVNMLPVPTVAIGGINLENVSALAGCSNGGIAVSSVLCSSETPYDMAVSLRKVGNR